MEFQTSGGPIKGRYHSVPFFDQSGAVLLVSGSSGGLDGPAARIYRSICEILPSIKVACLRLDYRFPSQFESCVKDAKVGIEFLVREKCPKIILVGHSFGGAVVISAAAAKTAVTGVISLATQTYGTDPVARISPRPILLLHGTDDKVLSDECSREVFRNAKDPRELKLYLGAGHEFNEVRDELLKDVTRWVSKHCRLGRK
ncbi:MAG: phospholipase [Verrucomicrobiales bacterium]|nr:phospholipase [Verrucomicrobiales bacterium]